MRHSYSSYATFKQCPRKFKYSYVDRLPVSMEPHPNAQRGTDIHKSIERFINEEDERLHPDIHKSYGHWMLHLREDAECKTELKVLLDKDFQPVETDEEAWIKAFLDLVADFGDELVIFDWKTGKIYDDHMDQRFLYGLLGLVLYPDRESVTVSHIYVDQRKSEEIVYSRDNLEYMMDEWKNRFRRIEVEEIFPPAPQFLCRYCPFSKQNGGPCQF